MRRRSAMRWGSDNNPVVGTTAFEAEACPTFRPSCLAVKGIHMPENIDEKIAVNETKLEYKNYVIWLRSYELKSGGWVPKALVVIPEAEGNGQQELSPPAESTLALREEADAQAFAMAKQWVDERLAGLRHDRSID